ncbi:MAG: hypothetical protein GY828_08005 [Candidatus Gracilibacteria bacterium]|nr:hypothetical protein [Candidatus Gracilibacteria bacterium]
MKHYIVGVIIIFGILFSSYHSYSTKIAGERELREAYNLLENEVASPYAYLPPENIDEYQESLYVKSSYSSGSTAKNLEVNFYPQSPFGKWGPIFNDTCEEASALLAFNYITSSPQTRIEFRDELLGMVDWQNKTFGNYKHTNVAQTAQMLEEYLGFKNYEIIDNPTVDEVKNVINNGNIMIAPFYAKHMNPNYLNGGPNYHFMVIKGYTQTDFITHDVGTKYGKDYRYSQEIIMERIHDYHPDDMTLGDKKIIVLKK